MSGNENGPQVPATDLIAFHDAILTRLRAAFPADQIPTIIDYPRQYSKIDAPAILIDLEDMRWSDPDPGTEQLPLSLHWSATCIIGGLRDDAQGVSPRRAVRALAAAVATVVHDNRWGMCADPARITSITPDAFDPALDQYEVWRVEWEQRALFDVSVFASSGILPTSVFIGVAPAIGPGHESEYRQIAP